VGGDARRYHLQIPKRKENTSMKIKTHVKAEATNGDIVIGSTAK
jgi:hypothetical protein